MEIKISASTIVEICNNTLQQLEDITANYNYWYKKECCYIEKKIEEVTKKNTEDWNKYNQYITAKNKWEKTSWFIRGKFPMEEVERPYSLEQVLWGYGYPINRVTDSTNVCKHFKSKVIHANEVVLTENDLSILVWIEHEVINDIYSQVEKFYTFNN